LTGIKPGVFSVSINERNALRGGYIGLIEWIYNMNRNQSFITFAIRDMLMKSESYDQSVKYLAEVPLVAPCYYILAGPKPGQVREHIYSSCSKLVFFFLKGCHYNSIT
jgi:acid ceramidase